MSNFIIFGAPGSGKGTQSELLIDKYNLNHISTGDVLRDHIRRQTNLGKVADTYISNGHLIPDELMIEILADTIDHLPEGKSGIILDGFPRTIPQAEELERLLEQRGIAIDAVVGLDVPEDELIDRLLKRGKISGRSDDNLDTINKRLDVYRNQTMPLRDFYESRGKYRNIEGTGTVEEIFNRIIDAIE